MRDHLSLREAPEGFLKTELSNQTLQLIKVPSCETRYRERIILLTSEDFENCGIFRSRSYVC